MPKCKKCNEPFPNRLVVDGKQRNLRGRKYCLQCSPFGLHNTRPLDAENYEKLVPLEPGKRRFLLKCPRCKKMKVLKSKQSLCYGCAVLKSRRKYKLRAIEYKGGKCQHCGYDKCVRALCFHHVDPSQKEFDITSNLKKWETMKKELDKCILLCHNCHSEEHDRLDKENGLD